MIARVSRITKMVSTVGSTQYDEKARLVRTTEFRANNEGDGDACKMTGGCDEPREDQREYIRATLNRPPGKKQR